MERTLFNVFNKFENQTEQFEYLIIVSLNIERNRLFLELFAISKDKEHKQELKETATGGQLRALCECVRNICEGRFSFTSDQKNKLLAHRDILSQLASCQIPLKEEQHFFCKNFCMTSKMKA